MCENTFRVPNNFLPCSSVQRHGEGSVSVHGAGDVVGEEVIRVLQRLTNDIIEIIHYHIDI